MVERRPPQPPATAQREDTVAVPVSRPAPQGAPSGNGKVLPPMPKDAPSVNNGRSATPPPPPASRYVAPQATAETRAPASPMPVVPEVDKRADRQAAKDAKAAERTAAKQAKESERAQKTQVAEVKESPKPSRRARLRMTRIDPWSVMKTAFLLSIALGVVIVVSVFMVWSVLDAANVWSSINQTVRDVLGGDSARDFDIEDYLGTRRVVGFAMVVGAVDVVLVTAIATLGAFLYNMSASLLGGIEVTLAEDK